MNKNLGVEIFSGDEAYEQFGPAEPDSMDRIIMRANKDWEPAAERQRKSDAQLAATMRAENARSAHRINLLTLETFLMLMELQARGD